MPDKINGDDASSLVHKNDINSRLTTTSTKANVIQEKCIPNESINDSAEESIHFRPLSSKIAKHDKKEQILSSDNDESILHVENKKTTNENSTNSNQIKEDGNNKMMSSSPFKGISLKDFESQRKIIEEQNKQKKEMLYKAIELQ